MANTATSLKPTTARIVGLLTEHADRTEETTLNAACVVWSYRLTGCWVDLVVSRRGGRIIRGNVLETGPGGRWLKFKGTSTEVARSVLSAAGL